MDFTSLAVTFAGFFFFGIIIAILIGRVAPKWHTLPRGMLAVIIVLVGDALFSPYLIDDQSGVIGGIFALDRFINHWPVALVSLAVVFVWVALFMSNVDEQE